MKPSNKSLLIAIISVIFAVFFCITGVASALEIVLEPANAQIAPSNKVKVNIFADSAVDLVSMGVKVTFDPLFLSVDSASKYEDVVNGWLLDGDGDPVTTGDQYNSPLVETAGNSVTMIGGHGPSAAALGGKVLLGWITFVAQDNIGFTNIGVNRAKYHPDDPAQTFDNFVRSDGTVDEPTNLPSDPGAVPADLATIYVGADACEGDLNGDGVINLVDFGLFRGNYGISCSDLAPGELCVGDMDGNGIINLVDFGIFRADYGRGIPANPCP